jgi:hypothetical protein
LAGCSGNGDSDWFIPVAQTQSLLFAGILALSAWFSLGGLALALR